MENNARVADKFSALDLRRWRPSCISKSIQEQVSFVKESLLNILRCPATGDALEIRNGKMQNGEIWKGELVATSGASYPIIRGIPRFVGNDQYASNFSLEWTVHKKTQLDTSTYTKSSEEFAQKIGFTREEIEGKFVLDAGVGMGRFSDVALKMGAQVVGADLSFAVDSAYENLGRNPNCHVVQADIFNLPFQKESFDFIYSIGVLHHTPNCKKAFLSLLPLLKPGGQIGIWVYSFVARYKRSDFLRRFTTKMPPKTLYGIVRTLLPVWECLPRIPLVGRKIFNLVPVSVHPKREWRILDTFDWYSPKYQSKHTYEEVEGWFREAGLESIRRLSFPVSVRGKKPS